MNSQDGLYFQNNFKTPDKIFLGPEAASVFEKTNDLFEKAKQVKNLNDQEITLLDEKITAQLSKLLDNTKPLVSDPSSDTENKGSINGTIGSSSRKR